MIPDELVDAFVQAAWGTDDPPALEALKRRDARRGLEAIFASVDVLDLLVQAGLAAKVGDWVTNPSDPHYCDPDHAVHRHRETCDENPPCVPVFVEVRVGDATQTSSGLGGIGGE